MKDITLSVVIIAKNAEDVIADCITSVKFADEILVIDGGSTDKTNHIAKKMGAIIIKGVGQDFAKQRTIGLEASHGMWILYVDTDERVSPSLKDSIKSVILGSEVTPESKNRSWTSQDDRGYVAFKVMRQNYYLGNYKWPKIEELERLFKKDSLKGWYGELHESPKIEGRVGVLSGYLLHYTHRTLTSMLDKTIIWSQTEAKLRLNMHHPKIVWWRLLRVMTTGFFDSYITQGGFKAGTAGFIESMYQSYSMFVTYASLWEMQKGNK